jgi:hypothetical protein
MRISLIENMLVGHKIIKDGENINAIIEEQQGEN